MNENENTASIPGEEMTPEEIAELEEERAAAEAARIAPYEAARDQRQQSAEILAEHDEMLAEMLYEMTMNEFGEDL